MPNNPVAAALNPNNRQRHVALNVAVALRPAGVATDALAAYDRHMARARELADAAQHAARFSRDGRPSLVRAVALGEVEPEQVAAKLARTSSAGSVEAVRALLTDAAEEAKDHAAAEILEAAPAVLAAAVERIERIVAQNRDRTYLDPDGCDDYSRLLAVVSKIQSYKLARRPEPTDLETEARIAEQARRQDADRRRAAFEAQRRAKQAEQDRMREATRAARRAPAGRVDLTAERREDLALAARDRGTLGPR